MGRVICIENDGTEHVIDVPNGLSIMEAATRAGVPGIDADCGGACACATCHVIVDAAWMDAAGAPDGVEREMLEFAIDPQPTSRLSCQITMRPKLDGLVVRVPETQR